MDDKIYRVPNKPIPTFFQIISTDYLSQNLFVMTFGVWVIGLIDSLIEREWSLFIFAFAALCTPLGLFFFSRRYMMIRSAFQNGREVLGQIIKIITIGTGKRRGDFVFEYEYTFDEHMYQFRNRVKGIDQARLLKNGQFVKLMVNEQDPSYAFIKDIYLVYIK